jgi:hypothetical protein
VPAGSLPYPPPVLVGRASHSSMECSSTNRRERTLFDSAASVTDLSPGWDRFVFMSRSSRHQVSETRLRGFSCGDFLHP